MHITWTNQRTVAVGWSTIPEYGSRPRRQSLSQPEGQWRIVRHWARSAVVFVPGNGLAAVAVDVTSPIRRAAVIRAPLTPGILLDLRLVRHELLELRVVAQRDEVVVLDRILLRLRPAVDGVGEMGECLVVPPEQRFHAGDVVRDARVARIDDERVLEHGERPLV